MPNRTLVRAQSAVALRLQQACERTGKALLRWLALRAAHSALAHLDDRVLRDAGMAGPEVRAALKCLERPCAERCPAIAGPLAEPALLR